MPDQTVYKIGIIGGGKMGNSIFFFLDGFKHLLVWVCMPHEKEELIKKYDKKLKRMYKTGAFGEATYHHKINNMVISDDLKDIATCDIIIETVVENQDVKSNIFRQLDKIAKKECIFTSNSSSIKPSRLYPDSERKEKFAGFHFFYPVEYSHMVEIISTEVCSAQTIDFLKDFAKKINKKVILLPENGGGAFILNKLFCYFHLQSFRIYRENILTFREIDDLIKQHIFPMGTFELHDNVGNDIMLISLKNYMEDMEYKEYFIVAIEILEQYIKEGRLGIKTGRGFYSYKPEEKEESITLKQISDEEREKYKQDVVNKLKCLYINYAFEAIHKGYCTEKELETAMEQYSGVQKGPMQMAREVGIEKIYNFLQDYYQKTGEKVFIPCPFFKRIL